MMLFNRKKYIFILLLVLGVFALGQNQLDANIAPPAAPLLIRLQDESSVWEIFERLGKIKLHKVDSSIQGFSAERGRELVMQGFTTDAQGKKTKQQSKYFVCTSCHNTVRETKDLTSIDPQARLDYAVEQKIPFLPASTFFGIVNRVSFYNDDYQKKYKDVAEIKAANRDIRKAIQVCATQCAQGRELENWEMESILAYFWSLELKIGDLSLNDTERKKIEYALNESRSTARAVNIIESKYLDKYPAHFTEPMVYRTLQYDFDLKAKRMENGKNIFDLNCKHCHYKKRYAGLALDNVKSSFKNLNKKLENGHEHSIYKITRNGTPIPEKGQKAYMPQFTLEKMSDTQIEDLRIYIQEEVKK